MTTCTNEDIFAGTSPHMICSALNNLGIEVRDFLYPSSSQAADTVISIVRPGSTFSHIIDIGAISEVKRQLTEFTAKHALYDKDGVVYTHIVQHIDFDEYDDTGSAYEDAMYQLEDYLNRIDNTGAQAFLISAENIDWRGRSGSVHCDVDAVSLVERLTIGNDCSLQFTEWDDHTLTGVCAHHDATTTFKVELAKYCDLDHSLVIPFAGLDEAKTTAEIANVLVNDNRFDLLHPDSLEEAVTGQSYDPESAAYCFGATLQILVRSSKLTLELAEALAADLTNLHLEEA